MKRMHHRLPSALVLLVLMMGVSAFAQITPSQDSYTDTSKGTTNFGAAATLGVVSSATSIQPLTFNSIWAQFRQATPVRM